MYRRFVVLVFSLVCFCSANESFRLEAFDEQRNNPSLAALRFRLTNLRDDPFENVVLKYYLPFDASKRLVVEPYYLGSNQVAISIDTLGKMLSVNVNIPALNSGVFPDLSGICLGLHYSDWSSLNKEKIFSYLDVAQFEQTDRVAVYSNGELLNGFVPNVPSLSLPDSSVIYLQANQKMTFAWRPVPGADSYRLTILDETDSSMVVEKETDSYVEQVYLNPGSYLWRVEASKNVFTYFERTIDFGEKKLIIDTINVDASYVKKIADLNVSPVAARKDTPLLDLGWGELLDSMEWDKPHDLSQYMDIDGQLKFSDPKHQMFDEEESWRCWAVAATMINHSYGGNMFQDEIKMFAKMRNKRADSIFFPFAHGSSGEGGSVLSSVFINTEIMDIHTSNDLIQSLKNGNPVETAVPNEDGSSHNMVIDACVLNLDRGDTVCRYLNFDNNGSSQWRKLKNYASSISIKDRKKAIPRMADSLIWDYQKNEWKDSDGDGVLDFDEIYRFKSNPQRADSDGDDIEDKIEIWSYTRLEKFPKNGIGVREEKFADIDGDAKRAESDDDSDGGGVKDGEEDVNHNGKVDEEERNPFNKFDDYDDYETKSLDYFTFYAFNKISLNDGVKCYDALDSLGPFCNIAAAGSVDHYTISIGVKDSLGNVYSRGDFFQRSGSYIDTLYTRILVDNVVKDKRTGKVVETYVQEPYKQNWKDVISDSLWKLRWPLAMILNEYSLNEKTIIVRTGESLRLKNGDSYSFIKVEAGGMLLLDPGEIWVNEIQLHDNSQLMYSQTNKTTILHVCGNFTWRAKIQNDDYPLIAQHFKLIQHSKQNMFVDNVFAGTILAPSSNVILGQSNKIFYGSVIANDITVHQYSRIYHIPFLNEKSTIYIMAGLK